MRRLGLPKSSVKKSSQKKKWSGRCESRRQRWPRWPKSKISALTERQKQSSRQGAKPTAEKWPPGCSTTGALPGGTARPAASQLLRRRNFEISEADKAPRRQNLGWQGKPQTVLPIENPVFSPKGYL